MNSNAPTHLQDSIMQSKLAHYMCCEEGADTFLMNLARALGYFPPPLFVDPYQHLLDELNEVNKYPLANKPLTQENDGTLKINQTQETQDILSDLKEKLKRTQEQEKSNQLNIIEAFLQVNYTAIIDVLEAKDQQSRLDDGEKLWLARAYFNQAVSKSDRQEEIELYDKLITRFHDSEDLALQEPVARTLFNKGNTLYVGINRVVYSLF